MGEVQWYKTKTCRLSSMLCLTFSFFLVEIIYGYLTNSLALVSDSYHMLSDVVALGVGIASVRISKMHSQKNTYGWARAEVLGALVNAVFLIALCFTIFVEALQRLTTNDDHNRIENEDWMLYVGIAGLVINLLGLLLFHQHSHGHGHSHGGGLSSHGHSHGDEDADTSHDHPNHVRAATEVGVNGTTDDLAAEKVSLHSIDVKLENKPGELRAEMTTGKILEEGDDSDASVAETDQDAGEDTASVKNSVKRKHRSTKSAAQLNMRGVFLHVLGDALGSVVVVVSALIIKFVEGDWKYKVDPAMSLVMVCIIMGTTIPLLKASALILMQTVPTHIQVSELKKKLIAKVEGVLAVHEFHVWQLAGNRIIASAHIRCRNLRDYMRIAEAVKVFFHNEGIHSTTIQPEFVEALLPAEYCHSDRCLLTCSCHDEMKCCPTPTLQPPTYLLNSARSMPSAANGSPCYYLDGISRNRSPDTTLGTSSYAVADVVHDQCNELDHAATAAAANANWTAMRSQPKRPNATAADPACSSESKDSSKQRLSKRYWPKSTSTLNTVGQETEPLKVTSSLSVPRLDDPMLTRPSSARRTPSKRVFWDDSTDTTTKVPSPLSVEAGTIEIVINQLSRERDLIRGNCDKSSRGVDM